MVVSPVHIKELEAITDGIERIHLFSLLEKDGIKAEVNLKQVRKRAEKLVKLRFGIADAAHVAFAEIVRAHFISCDDKLVKKCRKFITEIWCGNPVDFCVKEELK